MLHSGPTVEPTRGAASGAGIPLHELKFTLPAARAQPLLAWLAGRCPRDPRHPAGRITSVYFDDRELSSLRAKINSDFEKSKVRVRWYGDRHTGLPAGPGFVELKRKIGARRLKIRAASGVAGAVFAASGFGAPLWDEALEVLRKKGVGLPLGIRPILEIGFVRHRFLDPCSGARIAIDREIRARRANPALCPYMRLLPLAHAVLEVKGPSRDLSPWLESLRALGCHRESFSKYERCFRKATGRSSF